MSQPFKRIPKNIQDDPARALEYLVRLFGRSDGQTSWSAARGHLYLGGAKSLPVEVCPFNSIRAHTFTRHKDGFIERLVAAIAPLSADSKNVIQSYTNPVTDVTSEVSIFPYEQAYFHCPTSGTHRVDLESGDVTDGSIWANEHLEPFELEYSEAAGIGWANYTNPHERFGKTWSDTYRFRFEIHDLFLEENPFVSSSYGYVGESPLPPWLGASEGYAAWHAWGRKYANSADIPEDITSTIGEAVPQLLNPQT